MEDALGVPLLTPPGAACTDRRRAERCLDHARVVLEQIDRMQGLDLRDSTAPD